MGRLIKRLLQWLAYFATAREEKPAAQPEPTSEPVKPKGEPKWLTLARAELGVREGAGAANSPTVLKYYEDAGHPEVDHDDVAWCAAFVGAMLHRAGLPHSGSLAARSYLTWGKAVAKPYPGCVAVFKRGTGWQGHVAFYLSQGSKGITILGGNQGDAVSIMTMKPSDLLGYREPVAVGNSRTMRAGGAALGLTGAVALAEPVANGIEWLGGVPVALDWLGKVPWLLDAAPYLKSVAGWLGMLMILSMLIWRKQDWQEKGK
jgi:uncharacterized protein (TIGR02594 family)